MRTTRRPLRIASVIATGGVALAAVPLLFPHGAEAATFTGGNLVVYRVGTGSAPLTNAAAATFVDEFQPNGTPVQSVPLPTAAAGANKALTAAGLSRSEGQIARSADGRSVVVTGYAAAPGATGPGGISLTGTDPATVGRTIGLVDGDGDIDTSTVLTGAGTPQIIRSAVADSADRLWVAGGNGGVLTTTVGSGAATSIAGGAGANLNGLTIQGGQLFASGILTNRLAKIGDGLPASAATATDVPGLPTNLLTYGYALLDLTAQGWSGTTADTLYLANASERGGTVDKYTFDGSAWNRAGFVDVPGAFGLVADNNGGSVSLAVTTPTKLLLLTDPTGSAAGFSPAPPTTLATAATNTEFRGVALAPVPIPAPTLAVSTPANLASYTFGGSIPVSVTAAGTTPIATVTAKLGAGAPVTLTHGAGDTYTGKLALGGTAPGNATVTVVATDTDVPAKTKTVTRTVKVVLPANVAAPGKRSWTVSPVVRTGTWGGYATALSPNKKGLTSKIKGRAATVKFYGRSLVLTFTKRKDAGIATLVVDGKVVAFNTYSATAGALTRTFTFTGPAKVHTIQIKVSGKKVAKSSGLALFLAAYQGKS